MSTEWISLGWIGLLQPSNGWQDHSNWVVWEVAGTKSYFDVFRVTYVCRGRDINKHVRCIYTTPIYMHGIFTTNDSMNLRHDFFTIFINNRLFNQAQWGHGISLIVLRCCTKYRIFSLSSVTFSLTFRLNHDPSANCPFKREEKHFGYNSNAGNLNFKYGPTPWRSDIPTGLS